MGSPGPPGAAPPGAGAEPSRSGSSGPAGAAAGPGLVRGDAVGDPARGTAGISGRCAPSAQRRGDTVLGTAAPVPRWLLVEQPGAWGRDALLESGLDVDVVRRLLARAEAAATRVVLIRRPGRRPAAGVRRWAVVDSRPGTERVGWGSFGADAELLDLDLTGAPGEPSAAPVYLVCAYGRHDACCAIRGRPVTEELARHRPAATWECSHVGGDRFAANLVALPHGLYYAHVTPADALGLATAYERGEVDPALLRGRSAHAAPAQAAQHYARVALGDARIDALRPVGMVRLDPDTWRVRLAAPGGGSLLVRVRAGTGPAVRLTCSSTRAETPRTWELLDLREA